MNNDTNNEQTEQKRKPGRPRKLRNFILYRSGRKLKGFNTDLCIDMIPTQADITGSVTIYDGLGWDYVNWGRKLTRDGYFNAAQRSPFCKPSTAIEREKLAKLEEDYRTNPTLRSVMDAAARLFNGEIEEDEEPIFLRGTWWMRALGKMFILEAGGDGISRTRSERSEGKVWTSVYTKGAWYAVVNMIRPPIFCVKISGAGYESARDMIPDSWDPSSLANAILHGLWARKGVNSCEANVPKVEIVTQEPEAAPLARCKTCNRILTFDGGAVCFECEQLAKAEAAAEADPNTRRCKICGDILQGVFADEVCTRCAATVNVEADE